MGGFNTKIKIGILILFILLIISVTSIPLNAQTPISACINITTPGNYILSNDVSSNGTCIRVESSDVTFDCQDNTMVYAQSQPGNGISVSNSNNTIIKNCRITKGNATINSFGGISLLLSHNSTIMNNNISDFGASGALGLSLSSSPNSIIINNNISATLGSGYFSIGSLGLKILLSHNSTMINNTIYASGSATYGTGAVGLLLSSSTNSTIINNNIFALSISVFSSTGSAGLSLSSSSNSIIMNNNVSSSNADGLYLNSNPNSIISNNNISISATSSTSIVANGLHLVSSTNSTVSNNTISVAGPVPRYGLYLDSNQNSTILNNKLNATSYNIFISGSLSDYIHEIKNNTGNDKPILYFKNMENEIIDFSSQDIGSVIIVNSTNITIRNANLKSDGFYLAFINKSIIENSVINSSKRLAGINMISSDNNTLSHNTIIKPPFGVVGSIGLSLSSSTNSIISNNAIFTSGNAASGIILTSNLNSVVNNNFISTTTLGGSGIRTTSSPSSLINNNTIYTFATGTFPLTYGIFIQSTNSTISNNNISTIQAIGLSLSSSTNSTIMNNNITATYGTGVFIQSSNSILLQFNTIKLNSYGIRLSGASYDVTIKFSNIFNNTLYNVYNAQPANILAEYNWWGTANAALIAQSIYDFFDNPIYGVVEFYPFLDSPFSPSTLVIVTQSLLAGILGQFSSQEFIAIGGTPPYSWSLVSGSIPDGMNFYSNGILNGTPINAGNFTFTVRVTDVNNSFAERTFTKEVYVTLPLQQVRLLKGGTRPVPGRIINYGILFENIGNVPATNYTIAEVMEPWLTFVSATPTPSNITNATIFWNIPYLGPYEFSIFRYRARLNSSMPIGATVAGGPIIAIPPVPVPGVLWPPHHPFNDCNAGYGSCMSQAVQSCIPDCVPTPNQCSGPNIVACSLCISQARAYCLNSWQACIAGIPFIPNIQWTLTETPTGCPLDPNEKVAPDTFIKSNQVLAYTIHFENIGNTSAMDIFVNDTLDTDLNLSTLKVIAKNGSFISIQEGETALLFEQQKNQTIILGNISINITINETWTATLLNGMLNWSLINIDLPVNGTDELLFSIKPKQNLSSGTEIRNNATIQFEIFTPITTNDTLNIIDEIPPSCTMNPLPNITTTLNFSISWSGTDSVGEIDFYTIFSSVDDGPFNFLINRTTLTNATFTGQQGKTYRFICIATDTAGNTEVQPPIPEAITTIPNPTLTISGTPSIGNTITFSLSDPVNPNKNYILAMSLGNTPGILLSDSRIIPLNGDGLFFLSLFYANLIGLINSQGILDNNGNAIATLTIPPYAPPGLSLYAGFVSFDIPLPIPQAILGISQPQQLMIQ